LSIRGKKILCTRPVSDSLEFTSSLESAGAEVISLPVIEISPPENFDELDSALSGLSKYNGVVFSSSNAVKYFFDRIKEKNISFQCEIFALGEKTKKKIQEYGYNVTFIPDTFSSEELAKTLKEKVSGNLRLLFPRGNLGMNTLAKELNNIEEVIVYKTGKPSKVQNYEFVAKMLINSEIDCIAFFSPSAVTNFRLMFPDFTQDVTSIAVIGSTTLKRAQEEGFSVDIVAEKFTSENLSDAIINYYNAK